MKSRSQYTPRLEYPDTVRYPRPSDIPGPYSTIPNKVINPFVELADIKLGRATSVSMRVGINLASAMSYKRQIATMLTAYLNPASDATPHDVFRCFPVHR